MVTGKAAVTTLPSPLPHCSFSVVPPWVMMVTEPPAWAVAEPSSSQRPKLSRVKYSRARFLPPARLLTVQWRPVFGPHASLAVSVQATGGGAAVTFHGNFTDAGGLPTASLTVTVTLAVFSTAVGVPEITPDAEIDRPAGRPDAA